MVLYTHITTINAFYARIALEMLLYTHITTDWLLYTCKTTINVII